MNVQKVRQFVEDIKNKLASLNNELKKIDEKIKENDKQKPQIKHKPNPFCKGRNSNFGNNWN